MDSMGKSRSVFNRYAKLLRNFLRKECLNKKEKSLDFAHTDIVTFDPEVPCQLNGYDCGIFILNYVELFLKVSAIEYFLLEYYLLSTTSH